MDGVWEWVEMDHMWRNECALQDKFGGMERVGMGKEKEATIFSMSLDNTEHESWTVRGKKRIKMAKEEKNGIKERKM